jgi:exonuclease SbcC
VEASKKSLSDELGEESFDKLKSKVDTLEPQKKIAPLTDIIAELASVQNSINNLEKDRAELQQIKEKFETEYHSHDQLLEHLSETLKKKNSLLEELKILPSLPSGVKDTETFINQYEDRKEQKEQLNSRERDILLERANLEREAPELSSEEYQKQLTDAKGTFESVLEKGIAIKRIMDLSDRIIQSYDSSTYHGIEKKLEDYISIITDAKYKKLSMDESLPEGFVRKDGKTIPHELLSTGTRDVLALALRLSMAEYFLGNKSGFLLMDDPLVNLDPDRQQKTADVIREFCGHYQLLLFSCHPGHTGLLGGNVIEL